MKLKQLYNPDGRIEYIDLARGIAILLVMIGHIMMIQDSSLNPSSSIPHDLVYSFHIPLFFFISGICFSDKKISFKEFLKKKVRGILIPYATFSAVLFIYEVVVGVFLWDKSLSLDFLWRKLVAYIIQIRCQAIWFLACLFVVELLFFAVIRAFKGNKLVILSFSAVITALGIIYLVFVGKELPWNIDIALIMMIFIAVGYLFKTFDIKRLNRKMFLPVGILFKLVNQMVNYFHLKYFEPHSVDIYYGHYGNFVLFFIGAFTGIFSVIFLSFYFASHFSFIKYIGQNSLILFAFHQVFYSAFESILSRYSFSTPVLYVIWALIIVFTSLVLMAVTYLVTNSPLCVLIGKRYERKKL